MDFDKLLSRYKAKTCIISVEFFPDGSYGNIRVVAGNQAHCDDMASLTHHPFVPGSPYEACFPKNQNFEDHCYRCARFGKPLHAYVNLYMMGLWLNMFLLPLDSDQENVGYCIYCYDVAPKADSTAMSDLSAETATSVLNTCIKLRGSDDIEQAFQEVVGDIRRTCGSDHCCIMLIDPENCECSVLGESLREGSNLHPMSRYIEGFYAIAETWPRSLAGSTCLIIKDERDMEKLRLQNPIWGAFLELTGVKSFVLFPLRHGGTVLGYMWALNFNVDDVLKIKETLEVTTFLIASEISNYKLLNKLEVMGTIDSLTGVKNRNVMNVRIDRINSGRENMPAAVVFADVNGLKRINDERGRVAGDKMLRSAALILQNAFQNGDVYRAGGNKFAVIVPRTTEEELEENVEKVRVFSKMADCVRFSIGYCIGATDIHDALRTADEQMYIDRSTYYKGLSERKCLRDEAVV